MDEQKTAWDELLECLEFDHATGAVRALVELIESGTTHDQIQDFLTRNDWYF